MNANAIILNADTRKHTTHDERIAALSATVLARMDANERIVEAMRRTDHVAFSEALALHRYAERSAGYVRYV